MPLVVGIDCGINGAIATYDTEFPDKLVDVIDIPIIHMIVNKKNRKRVDRHALYEYLDFLKLAGVKLFVLEGVSARPDNSGMFVFGYTVGCIEMALYTMQVPMETVQSTIWKRVMKVKGKDSGTGNDGAIIARADELLPQSRGLWRGPKGGVKVDRAEAGIIAKFGGMHVLGVKSTSEFVTQSKLIYDEVE